MNWLCRLPDTRLADWIAESGGKSSGFDYLRVILALSVVFWHSWVTSYGTEVQNQILAGPFRLLVAVILPMFFALSGFLVAGSLQRNTVVAFLGLRALRIVPALAVEVCVSAFFLGPCLTSLALSDYFSDPKFQAYPLNIFGDIHYFLPGVFVTNPFPDYVNAQLWTIPFELQCYMLLAVTAIVGICRYSGLLIGSVLIFEIVWGVAAIFSGEWIAGSTVPGSVLPLCFLAGVALYIARDRIPANLTLVLAALGVTGAGLAIPFGDYIIPFPIAYLTVAIGLLNPPKMALVRWGDYSYGIYLYGFPIEQLVASWGGGFRHWYANLLFSVPLTVGLAAMSWNLVERPLLRLRTHVRKLDRISLYIGQQAQRLYFLPVVRPLAVRLQARSGDGQAPVLTGR